MHPLRSVGCARRSGSRSTWLYREAPKVLGGVGSQNPYIIVADVDAHHARAVAAGAKVVLDTAD